MYIILFTTCKQNDVQINIGEYVHVSFCWSQYHCVKFLSVDNTNKNTMCVLLKN